MKIAILFSGRINNDKNLYANFCNYFIKTYDADIFIGCPKDTSDILLNEVIELYKPKKVIKNNEEYFNVDKYEKNPYTNKHNFMCMCLNRLNVCKSFKEYATQTNTNYDLVISSRMDLMFNDAEFDIQCILDYIKTSNIFINNAVFIPCPEYDHTGINDQIAIGSYASITKYLEIYTSLLFLLESGVLFHPETLLLKYIYNLLNMVIGRYNTKYEIVRNIV